jgi:hypothetical protein
MVFDEEAQYRVCYKALPGDEYRQIGKLLTVSSLMEITGCMTVGNINLDQMANPVVMKAFQSSLGSAMGNVTKTVNVKPGNSCSDDEKLGETAQLGSVQSSMSFVASDVPKFNTVGSVASLKLAGSSGSLLKEVAQRAQSAGVSLPTPVYLGMTVSVRKQLPKRAHEYDAWHTKPQNISFVPTPGNFTSANPTMQDATIPAGVFPNVRGQYDERTGAWTTKEPTAPEDLPKPKSQQAPSIALESDVEELMEHSQVEKEDSDRLQDLTAV